MEMFITHPEFHKLNVGFALDEGKESHTHTHSSQCTCGIAHSLVCNVYYFTSTVEHY